jgi:hypothetical protein
MRTGTSLLRGSLSNMRGVGAAAGAIGTGLTEYL